MERNCCFDSNNLSWTFNGSNVLHYLPCKGTSPRLIAINKQMVVPYTPNNLLLLKYNTNYEKQRQHLLNMFEQDFKKEGNISENGINTKEEEGL